MPKEMGRGGPADARHDPIGLGPGHYPAPIVPRLSLGERDRRWANVRRLMERDGLDAIITLANNSYWDQANANGRYLTSIGGNCAPISVVFPRSGPVTAVTGPAPTPDYWLQFQDWVDDVRPALFHAVPVMAEQLGALGLDRGRIGIAGLEGVPRVPDGLVSHGAYRMLADQLPSAEFVNATFLMEEARFVKSDEELAMFRHGITLVEGALDVLDREARPGVPECVVYGRMMGSLLEQGSEPTTFMVWSAGNPQPPVATLMASRRPIAPDDIIQVELEAKWCGYLAHGATTIHVGGADATAQAMAELQHEAFQQCLAAMRPGVPMEVLVDVCERVGSGTPFQCKPILHGRGLGQDAPILLFRARNDRMSGWKLEANSVYDLKPMVSTADGTRKYMWGDTVFVTPDGGRRFGTRPAPLIGR